MGRRLCLGCMREVNGAEAVCPVCGHRHGMDKGEEFTLQPGTVLNNMYLVGKAIGQGGFGITYVGFDMMLERKVAIKEYFPMSTGLVTRSNRTTVVWSRQVGTKSDRERGFENFLKEARKMAKLDQIPAVVGVRGVFTQNDTAYIVMDYVEGINLKDHLQNTGPMSFTDCVKLFAPVMDALETVHRMGIIHRDISPDNLMLRPNGRLVLLDLGAAKDMTIQHSNGTVSSQLVAKHGFSPPEQYVEGGSIGSWTDVYAMCATIYYCVTGKLPPKSIDRMYQGGFTIQPPLTQAQFDVLKRGMALYAKDRIQTMRELLEALQMADHPPMPGPVPPERKFPVSAMIAAIAALIALCSLVYALTRGREKPETTVNTVTEPTTAAATLPPTTVPPTTVPPTTVPPTTVPPTTVPPTTVPPTTVPPTTVPPTTVPPTQPAVTINAQVGGLITFGSYEQDGYVSNGKEPISWIVLEKLSDRVLVISQNALDSQLYHYRSEYVTWATCSIRSWLNNDFYYDAFTAAEREQILATHVDGNADTDKLFFLSLDELNSYFFGSSSRICYPTTYAVQHDAYVNGSTGGSWWLLRSPGSGGNSTVMSVNSTGEIDYGSRVEGRRGTIRPAMWISLG